jgi:C_GCAxxG_C_C family probable redox protein
VLLAVCQEFNLETGKDIIPQIASGFAGGIGNSGAVCGAVVGAIMAIGIKQERAKSVEEMFENLALARNFRERFEAEMGTIHCRELTGLDLTAPQGVEELMNSEIAQTVCFPAVATAYRLVVELLENTT